MKILRDLSAHYLKEDGTLNTSWQFLYTSI